MVNLPTIIDLNLGVIFSLVDLHSSVQQRDRFVKVPSKP